jgi:hypothetical protein
MSDSNSWQLAADAFTNGRNAKGKYQKRVFGMFYIEDTRNTDGTEDGGETLSYKTSDGKQDLVAIRNKNGAFLNSSILPLVGRKMAWGNAQNNRRETPIQAYMRSKGLAVIPMYQLRDNGFDVNNVRVIDQGKQETVTVMGAKSWDWRTSRDVQAPDEQRHFTGAMLLETVKDGKPFQFLFDIDRLEIKHKRFNAFFVQLTKNVKTIDEAYKSLKPKAVIEAEKKKLNVKRQGEWFFIPTKTDPEKNNKPLTYEEKLIACLTTWSRDADYFDEKEWTELNIRRTEIRNRRIGESVLRAGQNRPNTVQYGVTINETTYVKGKVTHSGREHEDLILEGWHIAVPNTSVQSWQLDGNID